MKQREVLTILAKLAAKPDTLQDVWYQLTNEIWKPVPKVVEGVIIYPSEYFIGESQAYKETVFKLFVQTTHYHPEKLVELYPLFAMLCGDREGDQQMATIEW